MPSDKDAEVGVAEQVEQQSQDAAIPGTKEGEQALFAQFANKSEEWRIETDKKLVRKIDLHLMPFLILMYLLNFLDRANLAQARQGSLEKDLGMKGTDFNLATSIFFVGYLLMQLPSNILLTRVRPSIYLPAAVLAWGVVSTCNAATHNFTQLVIVRFFLGFAEAPFFPGGVFLMSSWYTRPELTRRIAWFYTGNSLANMFGGMIGYGVLRDLDGAHGIAGWRWLFIVEGVATIGTAFIAAYFLPDYPSTTRWLDEEERAFASWRLLADVGEADDRSASLKDGLIMALKDYRLYIFILFQHVSLLSQTFQYFFPTIVQTLGFSPLNTLLLTVPVWFATFLTSIVVNWTAAKTGDRWIHITALMLISAIGNAVATGSTNTGARYFAMFLIAMGAISAYTILVGWVANSFPRPLVKRSSAIAIANMLGNCASIYGSYMYPAHDGPRYIAGGSANASVCVLTALLAILLMFIHRWENKKLERGEREGSENDAQVGPVGFRYIY
ncbi:hypothetical protein VHEMI07600 [[Torrubiella] hemipterigena]|uniref:Major facilitator superfamily (MFS) profile domain-containing protein n=1 Tax=[Torrubiella] hemipterigena TaxID=1531966 RepID=A0A0A1TN80_9HYPO|nr:hypothetical protein VHEMI07600 [[Torrubiella] hemipterigena]